MHKQAPEVIVEENNPIREKTFTHPAFGCLSVTRVTCGGSDGGMELFNSAMKHSHVIKVEVSQAELIRNLHNDNIYSSNKHGVCQFYLSEAQWAQFVASSGVGISTPCTFRGYRDGSFVDVPGIESKETIKETFEREIKEKAARDIKEAKEICAELGKLLEGKTVGKTELKELHRRLQTFSGNFAGNMAFTQEMFAETMEKTIEAGKTEFESFVIGTAKHLGLEQMRNGDIPALTLDHKK